MSTSPSDSVCAFAAAAASRSRSRPTACLSTDCPQSATVREGPDWPENREVELNFHAGATRLDLDPKLLSLNRLSREKPR
eukprot:6197573-Pleurochrysis_carterae.AAC.1